MRMIVLTVAILAGVACATLPHLSLAADPEAGQPAPPADGGQGDGGQGGGQGNGEGGGNCERRPQTPTS